MKKYVVKAKNNVKRYVPEIIAATVTATALVVIVIKTNDNTVKIKLTPEAMNSFEDGSLTRFETEDEEYIYTIAQK